MPSLLKAIVTKFNNDPNVTAVFSSGMRVGNVTEGTARPYAVIESLADDFVLTTDPDLHNVDQSMSVTIIAATDTSLAAATKVVRNHFYDRFYSLDFDDGQFIQLVPDAESLGQSEDNPNTWEATLVMTVQYWREVA